MFINCNKIFTKLNNHKLDNLHYHDIISFHST
uniref:Uncharacterized protein n=1 Tax=Anguilla anguilla TaxID=7936 RepID=A0A0E9PBJ6_ANGAN